jgi:hypothetical protein
MKRGYNEEFFDLYSLNLPNGRTFNHTPRIGRPEVDFVAKGVNSVQINGGVLRPANLPRKNHAVLLHPDVLQNGVNGAIPLNQMDRNVTRSAIQSYWDSRGGVGFITSGMQEGRYENDPWAQLYTRAPDQYVWVEEKFSELTKATPDCIYIGPYDGIGEVVPTGLDGAYSPNDIRNALSSPAAAHAFWMAHESADYPYFKRQLWRYKPCVMNQYFRGSDNLHERKARLELTLRLVALALQHVGVDPAYGCVFFFLGKTEFAGKYTPRYVRPLEGGGSLISYDFPTYSQDFQLDLSHAAFKFRYPFNWEDTGSFGRSTTIVPQDVVRDDGFLLIHAENSSATRAPLRVSPFNSGLAYPCLHSPASAIDMFGLAAKWYEKEWAQVPAEIQPVAFAPSGSGYLEPGSGYFLDCYQQNRPYVEGAESGNNFKIKIADYVNIYQSKASGIVKFPSGRLVSINYTTGGPESIIGTF